MAKSKEQLLLSLKNKQSEKVALEVKVKGGDTTEVTRKALAACNEVIAATSAELKKIVDTPAPPVEKAKADESEKVDEVEAEKEYVVEDSVKHLVHAELLKGSRFNPETGEPLSKPYIAKFSVSAFKGFKLSAKSLGFTYKILHEPK